MDGGRHRDGVNIIQASGWNLGTCRSDVKGAVQAEEPRELEYRCGAQGRSNP